MMTTEQLEAKVKRVEATIHVEVIGQRVDVYVKCPMFTMGMRMDNATWREFCRRQLAVPPPLPAKGDQP